MDNGHGGDIFSFPKEARNAILDFSANINPLGMSPRGKAALEGAFEREAMRYPDIECRDMKQAIAAHYKVAADEVTCGNGATELMYAAMRALRPSVVYVPAPSFSEYRFAAKTAGIPVESFLLDKNKNFAPADESFLAALPKGAMVFLGNPNNPDGQLLSMGTFFRFVRAVEAAEGWLVIDESFIDFTEGQASFRDEVLRHPRVIIILSLTKFYAVPGLRIGISIAAPAVEKTLSHELCPWNVNGPVQLYITEAMQDEDYIEATRDYVEAERRRMRLFLSTHPALTVYDSTVNFLLLRIKAEGKDGAWLERELLPRGLHIRRCGNYEGLGEDFVRVAVRRTEENDRLIAALKEVFRA